MIVLSFSIENLSLMDINDLIDKGRRFTLVPEGEVANAISVEEYLNGTEVDVPGGGDSKFC